MRIRLLEALDLKNGLVKDAEGQIVHIVVDPRDRDDVERAERGGEEDLPEALAAGVLGAHGE
eukprot:8981710-Pyramimonas_sp.AAC.1